MHREFESDKSCGVDCIKNVEYQTYKSQDIYTLVINCSFVVQGIIPSNKDYVEIQS